MGYIKARGVIPRLTPNDREPLSGSSVAIIPRFPIKFNPKILYNLYQFRINYDIMRYTRLYNTTCLCFI